VVRQALLQHWQEEYDRSIVDPDRFWAEAALGFRWTKAFDKVSEQDGAHHKWFLGGKTNITLNALDRHAKSERRNRVAYIWLCEDGSERVVTYGQLYRTLIAPRLSPPTEWEDAAPVRFAQGVGLVFTIIGTIGYATGLTALGLTVTALALGAAFLNAAFGLCLGCEIYLRLPLQLRGRQAPPNAR